MGLIFQLSEIDGVSLALKQIVTSGHDSGRLLIYGEPGVPFCQDRVLTTAPGPIAGFLPVTP